MEMLNDGIDRIKLAQDEVQWRGNEIWGAVKDGEFPDQLSDVQLSRNRRGFTLAWITP